MKKRNLIIIAVVVAVLVLIVSQFYPLPDESKTSGTIGKVDKYRNSQSTQNDIVLRNQLLQDTAMLKATIAALDYYEKFLSGMKEDFKGWITSFKEVKINDKKLNDQLAELNSLVVFMENNLSTVSDTKTLLNKYYTKDTLNMTIDIQNNLLQFGNFVNNLSEKDKVIDSLFVNYNSMLEENKLETLAKTKEQAEKLIAIREKMLGPIVWTAYMMGNESRLNMALNCNIMNAVVLNRELNNKLGVWAADKEGSSAVKNQDQMNAFFSREALGPVLTWAKSTIGPIEITASVASQLKGKALGPYVIVHALGINKNNNKYTFSKQELGSGMKNNSAFSQSSLGKLGVFARGLGNIMGSAASTILGPIEIL